MCGGVLLQVLWALLAAATAWSTSSCVPCTVDANTSPKTKQKKTPFTFPRHNRDMFYMYSVTLDFAHNPFKEVVESNLLERPNKRNTGIDHARSPSSAGHCVIGKLLVNFCQNINHKCIEKKN